MLYIEMKVRNDNAATATDAEAEAARILRELADSVEAGQPDGARVEHPILDCNGLLVGREYDEILKDVADQQIEIDLDDGVQNNYPKFGDAVAEL